MSLFGLKDGDDQMLNDIRTMSIQQSSQDQFGYDTNHQNGFGFPGYGGHNASALSQQQQQQLQQQRSQLGLPGVVQQQQQQQQLYRNVPFNTVPGTMSGPGSAMNTPSRDPFLLPRNQPGPGTNSLADPGSFPALSRLRAAEEAPEMTGGGEDFPALSNHYKGGELGLLGGGSVFGKDFSLGNNTISNSGSDGSTSGGLSGGGGPSSAFFSPVGHNNNNNNSNNLLNPLGTLSTKSTANATVSGGLLSDTTNTNGNNGNNGGSTAGLLANLGLATNSTTGTTSGISGTMMMSSTPTTKYGLGGLLDIIRSTDREGNALVLGTDLTSFGLNLNASESLYPSFVSPFADVVTPATTATTSTTSTTTTATGITTTTPSTNEENPIKTPDCYLLHPPPLKPEHLSKFHTETLFYMFYQLPRDLLQAIAAQELYRRDWRYHGELKIWLKPRTAQEIAAQGHPTIQFFYFEIKTWSQQLFNPSNNVTQGLRGGNLLAGIIPEDEIRVKPQPQQQPAGSVIGGPGSGPSAE